MDLGLKPDKTYGNAPTFDDIMKDVMNCASQGDNGVDHIVNGETIYVSADNNAQQSNAIVCNDDIRWFEKHSKSELTMIVGQMTFLVEAISTFAIVF